MKYRFAYTVLEDLFIHIPKQTYQTIRDAIQIRRDSIFVPIPLHPKRLRWRGFNQAELIARILAGEMHCPLDTNTLFRTAYTYPQVEMRDREQRFRNLKNVFTADRNAVTLMNRKTIILVDDVYTTGATVRSAAYALKHAGAQSVWAITIAQ